jgi:hypothetical protein
MPRIINIHEPMEIVITPDTTHILIQSAGETPALWVTADKFRRSHE